MLNQCRFEVIIAYDCYFYNYEYICNFVRVFKFHPIVEILSFGKNETEKNDIEQLNGECSPLFLRVCFVLFRKKGERVSTFLARDNSLLF